MKNILSQLIIDINYNEVLDADIEDIVKSIRDDFRKDGFTITEGNSKSNNCIAIGDPESADIPVQLLEDNVKEFNIFKNNIKISMTRNELKISVQVGTYEGFDKYKQLIMKVCKSAQEHLKEALVIKRLGVRKINSLYIKDINKIKDYFNEDLYNCLKVKLLSDNTDILLTKSKYSFKNVNNKLNIITEINKGQGNAKKANTDLIESFDVYMCSLDLDVYWDDDLDNYTSIDGKMIELNKYETSLYREKCLAPAFIDYLRSDNDNDSNIFGGVNNE